MMAGTCRRHWGMMVVTFLACTPWAMGQAVLPVAPFDPHGGVGPTRGMANEAEVKKALAARSHEHAPCELRRPERWRREIAEAVQRGEIVDPATKSLPLLAPRVLQAGTAECVPTPTRNDIFFFEDTAGLLSTNFSNGQLFSFMADAANAVLVSEGDNFDFIGYWVNFTPSRTLGAAFYLGLENDVSGIGMGLFSARAALGIAGDNVEGLVMMWNIKSSFWQPGTGADASFVRLVLGQEFEHRFGMSLPNLLDGRQLQGNGGACGRGGHWNFRVDGQGSGMEIAEWIGGSTVTRQGGTLNFNTDIGPNDAVFSYTDLYIMGYVSPAEMDAGNSELRYLSGNINCTSPFSGTITTFSSADIVASAGTRSPSSATAQKDFRTAWVMIHRPENPPSSADLGKAAAILAQWTTDWHFSTLNRGTMNNTLRPSCDPKVELRVVGADVAHSITGGDILISAGGARVELELSVSDWVPDPLQTYRIQIDSAGYTSGDAGSLSPLTSPDPSAGAFIDTTRPTFMFADVPAGGVVSVDTTTLDYVYQGTSAGGPVFDTLVPRYAGTLTLDVSADAEGTFEISLMPEPDSLLTDDVGDSLSPLLFKSARIQIVAGNTACISAREIICDTVTTINNAGIANPPNPGYPCGFGSNHDGTLWFKFVATDTSARLSTCDSVRQDSTFAIYSGGCSSITQIGCGEDDCGPSGFLTDQRVSGLTVGETYLIQFSAWQQSDRGEYGLDLSCVIQQAEPARPDETLPDAGSGTRNRALVFSAGEPGKSQSIRVTPRDLPGAFASLNGLPLWVGAPTEISENSGTILPQDAPTSPIFQLAKLQCSSHTRDWNSVGPIHVVGQAVIPGGLYDIQVVNAGLEGVEGAFSDAITIQTSRWGDISTGGPATPPGPPDGTVDVPIDLVDLLIKFRNLPGAMTKSRSDLGPDLPNGLIDIVDITLMLEAFKGFEYPFPSPSPCP